MISATSSVFINRPVEEVFEFTAAFENSHLWQGDLIRSEQTSDGPLGVGATGIFAQKFMGREMENTVEVTVYDPPYQMCFRSTSGPIAFEGCQTCESVDGGTQFTVAIEGEAGGFFKVAEGMVQKQLASSLERDNNNLKAVLEG
jgi:hypothetical protein